MGFVVQYTKETIGEMISETNIHFESYEDFKDYQLGKLDFSEESVELSKPETIEHNGVVWYIHDLSSSPKVSHAEHKKLITVRRDEELYNYDPYPLNVDRWNEYDWENTKFYRYV